MSEQATTATNSESRSEISSVVQMGSYTEHSTGQMNVAPTHRNAGVDADTVLGLAVSEVEPCERVVGMRG
jgi:hypothetical protein